MNTWHAICKNKVRRFRKVAARTNITADWLYNELKKLLTKDNYFKCPACASLHTRDFSLDHIIPRSYSSKYYGIDNKNNLMIVCSSCNSFKNSKTAQEFIEWMIDYNKNKADLIPFTPEAYKSIVDSRKPLKVKRT